MLINQKKEDKYFKKIVKLHFRINRDKQKFD